MNFQDSKEKFVKDSIYGTIHLPPFVLSFIDHPIYQRSREIKQLGNVHYIFPSAQHTRFSHMIGAYNVATEWCSFLNNYSVQQITPENQTCIQIASLCHDLGHGPFSHLTEQWLEESSNSLGYTLPKFNHEDLSDILLRRIVDDRHLDLDSDELKLISNMIKGNNANTKKESALQDPDYMFQMVSNDWGVDVDRMDYLRRDTFHTFGDIVSFDRIIHSSKLIGSSIAFHQGEEPNLSKFFVTRETMFHTVYHHKNVVGIDILWKDMMSLYDALNQGSLTKTLYEPILHPESFSSKNLLTDLELNMFMKHSPESQISGLHERLSNRSFGENIYKCLIHMQAKSNEKFTKNELSKMLTKYLEQNKVDTKNYRHFFNSIKFGCKDPQDSIPYYSNGKIVSNSETMGLKSSFVKYQSNPDVVIFAYTINRNFKEENQKYKLLVQTFVNQYILESK